MEDNKLVSIIMPVYNVEKFLNFSIKSVLNQSYSNFELLLIDDGSTDNSKKICESFKFKDSRIVLIEQENKGPSAARNKGLSKSKGDYIFFLDSDDFLNTDTIETLVLNILDMDLVIGGYKSISYINKKSNEKKIVPKNLGTFTKYEFLNVLGNFINEELFHYTWNKLYKREIIELGVGFSEDLHIGEDMVFNLKYLEKATHVKVINKIVYNHILYNSTSITKSYQQNLFNTRKKIHISLKELLIKNELYKGKNKKFVERLYVKRIVGCFYNFHRETASLNKRTIIKEINKIVNDKTVRDSLSYFYSDIYRNKIFGYLIKFKQPILIYFYASLIWRMKKIITDFKK